MTERTSTLPRSERLPDGSAVVYYRGPAGRTLAVPCVDIFEAWRFEDRLISLQLESKRVEQPGLKPGPEPRTLEPVQQDPPSCPGCGDPLHAGQHIWCSRACGSRAKRKQEQDARPPRICPACSQALPPRPPGRGGHNQRYCNQACATWHKRHPDTPRPINRACATCETDISSRAITATFCSTRCRDIHHGRTAPPRPTKLCALPECAAPFTPKRERQRCCSEKHGKILSHREYRAAGKEVREPWGDARREHYHRRRALKKQASTGEPVRFTEIAERDQWTCGLCRKPVGSTIAWPDPMSPSLDHIIPLTKGGAHDPANVQLAHLRCNTIKGNRSAEGQPAPTG